MTAFLPVRGSRHRSWSWSRVRRLLAHERHRLFTPTLTGVGVRSHLRSRDVNLDTHVADVTNLMF
ncbi:hypothetical protein [Bradyrhizobium sp. Tv2a-2]|uniref:hypothetical protein n=1 Tax=Bradyrhizobium sp. Tv2a-2 TaxID=113395 RepID=UPI0003FB06A6|nr:hypothetical protein [Bradyrhizobium sp. Tv2a-2]